LSFHFDDFDSGATWKQRALFTLMSAISEDCWCAGWLTENEFELWARVKGDRGRAYGHGSVAIQALADLQDIAIACNGWIVWGNGRPAFLPMNEWLRLYAAWKAKP
jgi:hypothetical protein